MFPEVFHRLCFARGILLRCTRKGSFILNLRCRYAHGSILFRLLCFSRWFNVAGGKDHNNRAFRAAEVYDVEEDKWKILPPMSQARIECQGVFMDGKFIVISGYYGWIDRFSRSAEVFDTGEGVWSRVENMWSIGGCPKSCIPASGHLFCFQNLQVMSYNSEENVWEVVASLPRGMNVTACATVCPNQIFLSGSSYNGGEQMCYMFRNNGGNSHKWVPTDSPHDFVRHSAVAIEM